MGPGHSAACTLGVGTSTAAPGLSQRDRCAVLGRCMDANTTSAILAIALWPCMHLQLAVALHAPSENDPGDGSSGGLQYACVLAIVAQVQDGDEQTGQESGSKDVWEDDIALHHLQHGEFPPGASKVDRDRVSGLDYGESHHL